MERPAASTSSTDGTAPEGVVVGCITGAHGLRGQVRIRCWADDPETLLEAPRVALLGREDESPSQWHEVADARPGRPGELRVALVGVAGREAAEALRGRLVAVDPGRLAAPGPGEYYGYQLLGCRVATPDGGDLGTVTDIWRTGARDVLVIEAEGGRQRLVPAAAEFLLSVDIPARRIIVDPIPGLLD